MCRNITPLRGLQPEATPAEIEAAARQFVRKVSGMPAKPERPDEAVEQAIREIARTTTELLRGLPPRRRPPSTLPPLRRPRAAASVG